MTKVDLSLEICSLTAFMPPLVRGASASSNSGLCFSALGDSNISCALVDSESMTARSPAQRDTITAN